MKKKLLIIPIIVLLIGSVAFFRFGNDFFKEKEVLPWSLWAIPDDMEKIPYLNIFEKELPEVMPPSNTWWYGKYPVFRFKLPWNMNDEGIISELNNFEWSDIIDDYDQYIVESISESWTRSLPSPVFVLTDTFPKWTEKIRISWRNWQNSDSYFLKQFNSYSKNFTANFRLDLWNIASGDNEYLIRFYLENGEVKQNSFILSSKFEKIELGNNVLYYDVNLSNNRLILDELESVSVSDVWWKNGMPPILIQHNWEYIISYNVLFYDEKQKLLLELTDIKRDYWWAAWSETSEYYGNLKYFWWPIIWNNLLWYKPNHGDYSLELIKYNDKNHLLMFMHWEEYIIYQTDTQQLLYTTNEWYNPVYEKGKYIGENWTFLFENNEQKIEILVYNDDFKVKYYEKNEWSWESHSEATLIRLNESIIDMWDFLANNFQNNLDIESKTLTINILNDTFQRNFDDLSTYKTIK